MAELIYASTKNADLKYAIRTDVSDPVFWLRSRAGEFVFLDYREIDIFKGENKNPHLEAILLNPLEELARAEGHLGRQGLAEFLIQKFAPGEKTVSVPRDFPLDLTDHLRGRGLIIEARHPFFKERAVKSPEEIKALKHVAEKTLGGFWKIEEMLRDSEIKDGFIFYNGEYLTSEKLKAEVEITFIREGLSDIEGMIVAAGEHSAMPHHRGEGNLKAHVPIVCDLFPRDRATGYHSDLTRTYVKGEPRPEIIRMHEAVRIAQERAIQTVRPGMPCREVDVIVRRTFEELGFHVGEKGFIHGTGHGVGLEVHEAPKLNKTSEDVLEPGNVVTVEPGLYYPELGGVRIEDMVLVTEDGSELIVEYPKDLIVK